MASQHDQSYDVIMNLKPEDISLVDGIISILMAFYSKKKRAKELEDLYKDT
jgi:hypothetical protein